MIGLTILLVLSVFGGVGYLFYRIVKCLNKRHKEITLDKQSKQHVSNRTDGENPWTRVAIFLIVSGFMGVIQNTDGTTINRDNILNGLFLILYFGWMILKWPIIIGGMLYVLYLFVRFIKWSWNRDKD